MRDAVTALADYGRITRFPVPRQASAFLFSDGPQATILFFSPVRQPFSSQVGLPPLSGPKVCLC